MTNFANRQRYATPQGVHTGLARSHRAITDAALAAACLDSANESESTYLALAGVLDPPPDLLGSSFDARQSIAAALADTIYGMLHGAPELHFAIADIRYPGWVSDARPVALVRRAASWAKARLPKLGAGSFACVQLALTPSADRQEGFVVEARLRVLSFSASRERTEREIAKLERRPLDEKPCIHWNWIGTNDRLIAAASVTLLCAEDPATREANAAARTIALTDWAANTAVRRRYRFLLLARCPLSKLFFGTGFSQHRAKALISDAKYAAKQRAKLNPSVIAADEVACFAWDEAVRLEELGLRLPYVELR
ncbi:MAG: hypothetical protein QOH47_2497 [Sphingomonadales bacterium]|jgi:hypothetical protein|nr:hypothetical protein [Sphingomonadales bacterium]